MSSVSLMSRLRHFFLPALLFGPCYQVLLHAAPNVYYSDAGSKGHAGQMAVSIETALKSLPSKST